MERSWENWVWKLLCPGERECGCVAKVFGHWEYAVALVEGHCTNERIVAIIYGIGPDWRLKSWNARQVKHLSIWHCCCWGSHPVEQSCRRPQMVRHASWHSESEIINCSKFNRKFEEIKLNDWAFLMLSYLLSSCRFLLKKVLKEVCRIGETFCWHVFFFFFYRFFSFLEISARNRVKLAR